MPRRDARVYVYGSVPATKVDRPQPLTGRLSAVPDVAAGSTRALVAEAVAAGASSWAEVARLVGVSRSRASVVGRGMGLTIERPSRPVVLSVRVQASAARYLAELATASGCSPAEVHRGLLADGIRWRQEHGTGVSGQVKRGRGRV